MACKCTNKLVKQLSRRNVYRIQRRQRLSPCSRHLQILWVREQQRPLQDERRQRESSFIKQKIQSHELTNLWVSRYSSSHQRRKSGRDPPIQRGQSSTEARRRRFCRSSILLAGIRRNRLWDKEMAVLRQMLVCQESSSACHNCMSYF